MAEYVIKDEQGNYVYEDSIKMIEGKYYYSSFHKIEDGCIVYTKRERVEKALNKLVLYNGYGNLNHQFSIVGVRP